METFIEIQKKFKENTQKDTDFFLETQKIFVEIQKISL